LVEADLHIHTSYSNDGELSVQQIIQRGVSHNINVISITDHNSTGGIREALELSQELAIRVVPGIEIDCTYDGTDLHLLGYHIDWQSDDFRDLEKQEERAQWDTFPEMVHNLSKLGIDIDADEVIEKSRGKPPSGELFAEVLLGHEKYQALDQLSPYRKGGERSEMPYLNFYLDYFAQGKPAYVKVKHRSFAEALDLVRSHGGIPVIAHPGQNFRSKEQIVRDLLDQGAGGLEVFNNYHDPHQMSYFAQLVKERGLLMTCGSDFHGKNKPLIEIGKFGYDPVYEEELVESIRRLTR
jgi:predicted metal-dependent phosphoesterase TrpH